MASVTQHHIMLTAALAVIATCAPTTARAEAPAPRDDRSAQALWDEAQRLAYSGESDAAVAALERLIALHPGSPQAAEAEALLRRVPTSRRPGTPPTRAAGTSWGYYELIVGQSLHGLWTGGVIGFALSGPGDVGEVAVLGTLGGTLLGFGLSVGLAPGDLSMPQATALNLGALVGGVHGLALREVSDVPGQRALLMLASQAGGMAIGGGLAYALKPSSGDVALASSTALWTTTAYLLLTTPSSTRRPSPLLVTDLGLLLGGALAYYFEPTRQQVSIADAGALVGGLAGLIIAPAFLGDPYDDDAYGRVVTRTTLVGVGLGLVLGGVIARSYGPREGDPLPRVMLMPEPGGASVGITGYF